MAWGETSPTAGKMQEKAARAAGKPGRQGTWRGRDGAGACGVGLAVGGLVGRSPPHKGGKARASEPRALSPGLEAPWGLRGEA